MQKKRYKNKDGKTRTRWVHRYSTSDHSETILDHFFYKLHAYGTDYNVQYHQEASGSWLTSDTLTFQACHQQTGVPSSRS